MREFAIRYPKIVGGPVNGFLEFGLDYNGALEALEAMVDAVLVSRTVSDWSEWGQDGVRPAWGEEQVTIVPDVSAIRAAIRGRTEPTFSERMADKGRHAAPVVHKTNACEAAAHTLCNSIICQCVCHDEGQ